MSYVDDAFAKLKHTLEITATERQLAKRRHGEIREYLRSKLDLSEDFLTGSYGRDTKTKPLKDVDIFVVLDRDGADAGQRSQPPAMVLEDLARTLRGRYSKVSVQRRSCTIAFGDTEEVTSFDVVPAFQHSKGGYEIPDGNRGAWVRTDPTFHAELVTKKNAACGGKWVPFVKMVKGWNREVGEAIKPSFLIEVMALKVVQEPFGTYQDEITFFLATAADQIMDPWPDPANLGPDVNSSMDAAEKVAAEQALREALEVAERAVRLEDQGEHRAAVEEWRRLFGWRMPRP